MTDNASPNTGATLVVTAAPNPDEMESVQLADNLSGSGFLLRGQRKVKATRERDDENGDSGTAEAHELRSLF